LNTWIPEPDELGVLISGIGLSDWNNPASTALDNTENKIETNTSATKVIPGPNEICFFTFRSLCSQKNCIRVPPTLYAWG
jgi:hypothetical protein